MRSSMAEMVTRRSFLGALGLLALDLSAVGRSMARAQDKDHDQALREVRRGDRVRLRAVLARIRRRFPGRVIDAEHLQAEALYKILWRTDAGKVFQVVVDARAGRILRVSHRGKIIWRPKDPGK
ncbi:MAG: PepSY domain-containing protein [Alphaproteobacteria bacterium]